MNIALTGANGSIGKELIPFLKGYGHEVYSISSSIPRDGKFCFSYEELITKTIDVKIDVFFHNVNLTIIIVIPVDIIKECVDSPDLFL